MEAVYLALCKLYTQSGHRQRTASEENPALFSKSKGRGGRHPQKSIHRPSLCGPSRGAVPLRTHPACPAEAQSNEAI